MSMQARFAALVGFVMVLGALAVWFVAPGGMHVAAAPQAAAAWSLPAQASPDVDAMAARIDAVNPWGLHRDQADQGPLTPPEWRILGSAANGTEHLAVIKIEGQTPVTLKAGDALPGGAKICAVDADRLCVVVNGKKRVLGIYRE